MSALAKEVSPPLTGTPLQRVARLADVIRMGGDEAKKLRHVPPATIDALADAGLRVRVLDPEAAFICGLTRIARAAALIG